jgi:hypothetical protein
MDVHQLDISEGMIFRETFIGKCMIMLTKKWCDPLNRRLSKGRNLNGGKRRAVSMPNDVLHCIGYQELLKIEIEQDILSGILARIVLQMLFRSRFQVERD